ncbi:ANTH domain-containing protein [Syncephalis plumigaleata]|nr:ANTH domain-containing protein [Syncephalis plumigaleata]
MSLRSSASMGGLRPAPAVRTRDMERSLRKATRNQPQPIKQKHLDVLVASSWSHEVPMSDCFTLLDQRIRENHSYTTIKSLIVVHVLMRDGSSDRVMGYLVTMPGLLNLDHSRDRFGGQFEYIRAYASYLEEKVVVYRELKIDFVRAYAGTFARASDPRARSRIGGGGGGGGGNSQPPSIGRLRRLPIEKGLLKEVATVQRLITGVLKCRFHERDMDNHLTLDAFRLLIRDLLRLFQAVNEGVINILEHYFEMEYEQAAEALSVYKSFARQTERVVEYLEMARKMHYAVQINIPRMKHPPISLVDALEDYLRTIDPSSSSASATQKSMPSLVRAQTLAAQVPVNTAPPTRASTIPVSKPGLEVQPWSATSTASPAVQHSSQQQQQQRSSRTLPPNAPPEIIDFFASIEDEQRFLDQNPALVESAVANTGNNPFHGQIPAAYQPYNPFRQTMLLTDGQPMATSNPMSSNPFGMGSTGFDSAFNNNQLNGLDLAVVSQSNLHASSSHHLAVPTNEFNPFATTSNLNNNYAASNYTTSSIYTAASSTSTSPEHSPWALTPYQGPPATTGRIRESLNPFLFSTPAAAASTSWLPSTSSSLNTSNNMSNMSNMNNMNNHFQQQQQPQQQSYHHQQSYQQQQQQQQQHQHHHIPNLF